MGLRHNNTDMDQGNYAKPLEEFITTKSRMQRKQSYMFD